MTEPAREVRCGLDRVHDEHEHWQGHCDGQPVDPEQQHIQVPLETLYSFVSAHPRPWSWATLTRSQAADVRAQLDLFVAHYNRTYAVEDRHLILGCWPLHPGLAHELTALHSSWLLAMTGGLSTPDTAMGWFDRWLPGFQARLPHWYGIGDDRCKPGKHDPEWNAAARKLADAGLAPESAEVDVAVERFTENPAVFGPLWKG